MHVMHRAATWIVGLCWLAFAGRWLFGLRGTARARRTTMNGGSATWTTGNVVAFAVLARYGYRVTLLRNAAAATGAVVAVAGSATSLLARRELARNWSKDAALNENQELITTGPYGLVRHPIYSGYLGLLIGTALLFETPGVFALTALQTAFLAVKARQEEKLLADAFPTEYPAYQSSTGRFIPRFRRIRRSAGSSLRRSASRPAP